MENNDIFSIIAKAPEFITGNEKFRILPDGCYASEMNGVINVPVKLFFGEAEKFALSESLRIDIGGEVLEFPTEAKNGVLYVSDRMLAVENENCKELLPSHAVSFNVNEYSVIKLHFSRSEEPLCIMLMGNEINVDAAYGTLDVNESEPMPVCPDSEGCDVEIIAGHGVFIVLTGGGKAFGVYRVQNKGNELFCGGEGSLDKISISEIMRKDCE